jgi:group II intron reverse transcriptase/maturase
MILEPVYEADFHQASYGFRPGRSCHDALATLGQIIATKKVNWVSDADIKGFFDNVSHEKLEELLRIRISDPRMLALIVSFLKCGVLISGQLSATEDGVPQGSCLSPLLANVYLHYVLDQWFEQDVKVAIKGEAYLVRYADDFICCFQYESDARAFQTVLPKRLDRFSLEVAEDKTKLLRFGRFAERDSTRYGEGRPGNFDFLGFTHYCGTSRAGKFKLKRRTSRKKLRQKLQDMKEWLHSVLIERQSEVWKTLNAKLRGHYQYYSINDNWPELMVFLEQVKWLVRRWLNRRSQNTYVSWDEFRTYCKRHPLATPGKITDLIAMSRSN